MQLDEIRPRYNAAKTIVESDIALAEAIKSFMEETGEARKNVKRAAKRFYKNNRSQFEQ